MPAYQRRSPARVLLDGRYITERDAAAASIWSADGRAAERITTGAYGMDLARQMAGLRFGMGGGRAISDQMHDAMLRRERFARIAAAIDAEHGVGIAGWLLEYLDGHWTPNSLGKLRRAAGLACADPKTIRDRLADAIRTLTDAFPEADDEASDKIRNHKRRRNNDAVAD